MILFAVRYCKREGEERHKVCQTISQNIRGSVESIANHEIGRRWIRL
jgi:hypothetical protein